MNAPKAVLSLHFKEGQISLSLPISHCVTAFKEFVLNQQNGDFPGGPVVKTLPSNAGGAVSIPGQGAVIPHASWPMSNRNSIVTNSVKTLKMVKI